ncbi:MAG: OmpH family outer membrane protein [Bacteroidota bacterium]
MKNVSLILNIVLLAAVGFLYYQYYTHTPSTSPIDKIVRKEISPATANAACKIAYFEMDSVESNCEMVHEVKAELKKKDEANMTELSKTDQQIREKMAEYQNQANTMTQAQGEMAQQDLMQRQQKLQSRKQELDQEYQGLYMRLNTDMKSKIEGFLNEYNKDNAYSYIFAYESGLFFYKDSAYNITRDVVSGLNAMYKSQKKK